MLTRTTSSAIAAAGVQAGFRGDHHTNRMKRIRSVRWRRWRSERQMEGEGVRNFDVDARKQAERGQGGREGGRGRIDKVSRKKWEQ